MNNLLIFVLLLSVFGLKAQTSSTDNTVINFKNIKDVLQNDMLEENAQKSINEADAIKQKKIASEISKSNVPLENDFWHIVSELWLVKNATLLKWDFRKPDYGVEEVFKKLLEKHGHYEINFKILYIDSPMIFHCVLPGAKKSLLFVISVPFIKALDLSKVEIAMLLYENFLRNNEGQFIKKVSTESVNNFIGSNFHDKPFDKKMINDIYKSYDDLLFKSGFSFQDQFDITSQVGNNLKSDLNEWAIYYKMIEKIDTLVKTNVLYRDYLKLYPSPELQLGWLRPKELKK